MSRFLLTAVVSVAALWTTGCGSAVTTSPSTTSSSGGETVTQPGTTASEHGAALVRFVNADPSGTGLEVLAGSQHVFGDVAYKAIAPYLETPRGVTQFNLRMVDDPENLATARRELLPGRHYTIIAFPQKNNGTRLQVLSDNLGLLEPGVTRVRLINATTDVDDLDLFRAGTKTHILHGIDSGMGVTMSYTDMEAGPVEIRAPDRQSPTLVAKLMVEENHMYTFIVVGSAGSLDTVQVVDSVEP